MRLAIPESDLNEQVTINNAIVAASLKDIELNTLIDAGFTIYAWITDTNPGPSVARSWVMTLTNGRFVVATPNEPDGMHLVIPAKIPHASRH